MVAVDLLIHGVNLHKPVLRLMVAIILIGSSCILLDGPGAKANPFVYIRDNDSSGTPIPTNDTTVFLRSEVVEAFLYKDLSYKLGPSLSEISALYRFRNPSEENVTVPIALPFWSSPIPDLFSIEVDGTSIEHCFEFSTPLIQTHYYLQDNYSGNPITFSFFNLTIGSMSEVDVHVNYTRTFFRTELPSHYETEYTATLEKKYLVKNHYFDFRYLAVTGRYWSERIETARFDIYIHRDLMDNYTVVGNARGSYPVEGAIMTIHDDYILFSFEFEDWEPEYNIGIHWENFSSRELVDSEYRHELIMAIGFSTPHVLIIIITIVLYRRQQRRLKRTVQGTGSGRTGTRDRT